MCRQRSVKQLESSEVVIGRRAINKISAMERATDCAYRSVRYNYPVISWLFYGMCRPLNFFHTLDSPYVSVRIHVYVSSLVLF